MYILIGLFSAMICIMAFLMGFFLGRKFPEKLSPVEPTPELKKKQDEEAQAYRDLFSYAEAVAYSSALRGDAT